MTKIKSKIAFLSLITLMNVYLSVLIHSSLFRRVTMPFSSPFFNIYVIKSISRKCLECWSFILWYFTSNLATYRHNELKSKLETYFLGLYLSLITFFFTIISSLLLFPCYRDRNPKLNYSYAVNAILEIEHTCSHNPSLFFVTFSPPNRFCFLQREEVYLEQLDWMFTASPREVLVCLLF